MYIATRGAGSENRSVSSPNIISSLCVPSPPDVSTVEMRAFVSMRLTSFRCPGRLAKVQIITSSDRCALFPIWFLRVIVVFTCCF